MLNPLPSSPTFDLKLESDDYISPYKAADRLQAPGDDLERHNLDCVEDISQRFTRHLNGRAELERR